MKNYMKITILSTTLLFLSSYSILGNFKHRVQENETLWSISNYYEIDVEDIVRFNPNIDSANLIYTGDEIMLPIGEVPVFNTSSVSSFENKLLKIINDERVKNNLKPLNSDKQLKTLAKIKNEDMNKNNYFSHNSKTYDTVFSMLNIFDIEYKYAGENIAYGQDSVEQVFIDWINNDENNNILNENFTNIGISYIEGENDYWTLIFTGN